MERLTPAKCEPLCVGGPAYEFILRVLSCVTEDLIPSKFRVMNLCQVQTSVKAGDLFPD